VTFATYIAIALYWKNESLLTAQAFTAVALISLLANPVLVFIQMFPFALQSIGCFDRVQEFCNYSGSIGTEYDTRPSSGERHSKSEKGSAINLKPLSARNEPREGNGNAFFAFTGQSFGWDKSKSPFLKNIEAEIQLRKFTAVIGPVGSGKTTFIESILGETVTTTAMLENPSSSIAYCAQEPWLENGTIRANIVGVSSYHRKWYDTVKAACALNPDLEELELGDQTEVGSKGLNLSGGQKQRIVC
jgi:ATP-binding cassette, subfamily C (CFTR/MRP), member 1